MGLYCFHCADGIRIQWRTSWCVPIIQVVIWHREQKSIEERGSRDRLTATYYPKSFYLKNLQFLMHLRLESIKGQLPHKSPLPTLDVALSELIA
jgi:hypothetical protein